MTAVLRAIAVIALLAFAGYVAFQAVTGKTGSRYYMIAGQGADAKKVELNQAEAERLRAEANGPRVEFSWPRTFGLWLAALLTLAILSFLYKDNPLYRFAEHLFVGVSAAYIMVLAFWDNVIKLLFVKLDPWHAKRYLLPDLNLDELANTLALRSWLSGVAPYEEAVRTGGLAAPWYALMDYWFWIPTVLGVMLLWRLAPKGGWISRWPLAFIIGATAGIRLVAYLQADFVAQIRNAIVPIIQPIYQTGADGAVAVSYGMTFYASVMNNWLLLFGTLCVLVYFFFSLEHKGVVGRVSRLGVWVLMIAFGAGFGYTVMGRIALLVGRFQFLATDWLGYEPW